MTPNPRAIGLTMISALITLSANAQSRIQVTDVYVTVGMHTQSDRSLTLDEFRMLAPQSVLLSQDLSGYSSGGGWGHGDPSMFSASVGIRPHDKPNHELRVGVSYISGLGMLYRLSKQEHWRYDTLTSNQTGEVHTIDSVVDHRYDMHYTSDQLRLDLSMIWRTDPGKRWSLFAGVGASAGVSINANTSITHVVERGTMVSSGPFISSGHYSFPYGSHHTSESETFTNKSNMGFSAMLPMGVDWRIGKNIEFLRLLHLFYEFRPGINFLMIPEVGTFKSAGVQQLYGIRVTV